MHFWIDKRSQCGYSGRHRVPSSLSAGVGRARGRVGVGVGRKGMVTPVHRFQAVECVTGVPRRPPNHHRSTQPPNYHHPQIGNGSSSGPPTAASRRTAAAAGGAGDGSTYVELGGVGEPPAPASLSALAAARAMTPDTLLRAAALGLPHSPHAPHMVPAHVKCGMWASFALAAVFVAGAKFYFSHQVEQLSGQERSTGGLEAVVLCALVVSLLLGVCAVSVCRARTHPPPPVQPVRVSSTAHHHLNQESNDDLSLGALLSMQTTPTAAAAPVAEPPPPPYHIAVLLPPRAPTPPAHAPTDIPPPTYEKAVS